MAKLTVTVAVVLLLFAFAQARFPLDLEKKDVNQGSDTVLPESDEAINFLRLPTEKPESEIEIGSETETDTDTPRFVDWDLGNADAKLTETETSEGETETVDSAEKGIAESEVDSDEDSSVVTVITFRPSNRHFRWLPFPSGRRGRHFHRRHEHGHFRGGDIGYGNDMILSEEGAKFEDRPRHVPGRWMRFHGGDDMRMRHHRFGNSEFMRREREIEHENRDREYEHHEHDHEHHHDEHDHEHDEHDHEHEHHHDHEHEHHHDHHRDHDHHHEQSNGFVGKIRKFLTNF